LGHRRDWSHRLTDIQHIDHNERYWRIYVGTANQHYQGLNAAGQMDAQLFTAVANALLKK
jgi:hypothetical protein